MKKGRGSKNPHAVALGVAWVIGVLTIVPPQKHSERLQVLAFRLQAEQWNPTAGRAGWHISHRATGLPRALAVRRSTLSRSQLNWVAIGV
jgi:hypothetical protein